MKCIVVEFIRKCYTLTGSKALRGIQYISIKSKYSILILQFLLFQYVPVHAQFNVKNLLKKAEKVSVPEISLFKQQEPITTSFKDVDMNNALERGFGNNERYIPLDTLELGPKGYILKPGFYSSVLQSFCIRAGTPAPSKGDGYANAELKGPMADIVNHILWNALFYPKVRQRSIQLLLWAIIAKTKYSDFSDEIKKTADTLLTARDISKLKKGGGATVIADELFNRQIIKMPDAIQSILTAENKIRQLSESDNNKYEEYEHWAVAAEIAVSTPVDSILKGRWNYDPEGYYIRYFPQGYKHVLVQLYVPVNIPANSTSISNEHGPRYSSFFDQETDLQPIPKYYDPTSKVSQPGKDGAQRLISRTPSYFEYLKRRYWESEQPRKNEWRNPLYKAVKHPDKEYWDIDEDVLMDNELYELWKENTAPYEWRCGGVRG